MKNIIRYSLYGFKPQYQSLYEDFKEGVCFFIEEHKNNLSLNHLKHKVPCWIAEIEGDAIVYDCNWKNIVTLDNPVIKVFGCYIPKREMYKIYNIYKVQR